MTQLPERIETDAETVARDLGRLVLTIIELVRQLMERQAIRRVEAGDLPAETVERLGLGLMRLEEAMADLRDHFGLCPEDLNIDLGPLGDLLPPPGREEAGTGFRPRGERCLKPVDEQDQEGSYPPDHPEGHSSTAGGCNADREGTTRAYRSSWSR